MKPGKPIKRTLRSDRRGAVVVEFAVAAMPLLSMFFSFTEAGKVYTANLMLKHSAGVAARAAAVIADSTGTINPRKNGGGGADTQSEVTNAAVAALGKWAQLRDFTDVKVDVADRSSESDPYGNIAVTVTATYNCTVPLGNRIICGLDRKLVRSFTAVHAHQGARYKME